MEKASEVYNKLKLRFVVKGDMPTKPKSDDKESQDNGKGSQNTGTGFIWKRLFSKPSQFGSLAVKRNRFHTLGNPNVYFLVDSAPMNGESEQKQQQEDDVEEEKPKSLGQEENDQHTASSPKRYLRVSYQNLCS